MAYEAYANGWPDLKQLQELAEKVGNIPTFTSSDKEAIEDLISNAQALISVAEDGAEGVPFDNTGTGFTSTDVQAAIEEAASMGGIELSTTPVKIGKWGTQDLYGVLIDFGALPNATTKDVTANLSGKTIRHLSGVAKNPTSGVVLPLPSVSTSNIASAVALAYTTENDKIRIEAGVDRSGFTNCEITVLYTIDPTP